MMNREIKFRGKRVDNGEWVYGSLLSNGEFQSIWDSKTADWRRIIPKTVGQFTGLHDKNGKEIYKGDIIVGEPEIKMIVEWDERVGCFCGVDPKMMVRINGTSFHKKEITGNIHDNSELLQS